MLRFPFPSSVGVGCKFLSTSVRRAGVAGNDVLGKAGSENVQGEDQKKLDVVANEVFKNVLRKSGQCAVLVTEEEEEAIFFSLMDEYGTEDHRGNSWSAADKAEVKKRSVKLVKMMKRRLEAKGEDTSL